MATRADAINTKEDAKKFFEEQTRYFNMGAAQFVVDVFKQKDAEDMLQYRKETLDKNNEIMKHDPREWEMRSTAFEAARKKRENKRLTFEEHQYVLNQHVSDEEMFYHLAEKDLEAEKNGGKGGYVDAYQKAKKIMDSPEPAPEAQQPGKHEKEPSEQANAEPEQEGGALGFLKNNKWGLGAGLLVGLLAGLFMEGGGLIMGLLLGALTMGAVNYFADENGMARNLVKGKAQENNQTPPGQEPQQAPEAAPAANQEQAQDTQQNQQKARQEALDALNHPELMAAEGGIAALPARKSTDRSTPGAAL